MPTVGWFRKGTNQKTEVIKYNEKIHWNNSAVHTVVGMFTNYRNTIACWKFTTYNHTYSYRAIRHTYLNRRMPRRNYRIETFHKRQ